MPETQILTTALKVRVRDVTVEAEIGLYEHEQGRRQPLVIDVEVTLAPVAVHAIPDTYNYEKVVSNARTLAESGHIDLVETFAQRLAAACLADHRVISARVRVEKPEALAGSAIASVEVVAERGAPLA